MIFTWMSYFRSFVVDFALVCVSYGVVLVFACCVVVRFNVWISRDFKQIRSSHLWYPCTIAMIRDADS